MATSDTSITTAAPSSPSPTTDNFRTVFVTITTSAGSHYTMNATEKMWDQKATVAGQWSAVSVMVAYVLFAFCLFLVWFLRRRRREPQVRPSSVPPEVTQRGDGSFLVMPVETDKMRRVRSVVTISPVSAIEANKTSRYSFEDPENDQSRETVSQDGSLSPTNKSVRSLALETLASSPISISPTIPDFPTPQRSSAGTYVSGHRRYASSQTNLIPLLSPLSQYQQDLGEVGAAEAAREARPGGGLVGHGRTVSQSTLRYYLAQSEDDLCDTETEPLGLPVPVMPAAAMVGGHNGNPCPVPV